MAINPRSPTTASTITATARNTMPQRAIRAPLDPRRRGSRARDRVDLGLVVTR
jgi:hypothetical protein